MSTIVVTKLPAVVVQPSETVTTAGKAILSMFGKPLITLPSTVLYVFDHPIHEPVETVRKGFSQALFHYYPLAGRLACDDNNDIHIDCTGEGVTFVAASADCTIKELMIMCDRKDAVPVQEQLAEDYPMESCSHGDPLVMMQVTSFRCGGFVVGVTWNHGVADGFGIGRFVQTVGELARGLPTPSVIPVLPLQSSVLQVVPPPCTLAVYQAVFQFPPSQLVGSNITIPAGLVHRIRFGGRRDGRPPSCTLFEAVAAVLWRCRTRVVMSDPEAPAIIVFTANSRKHMGIDDGYYGNCTTIHMAIEKSSVVANACIMDLVGLINRAKEQIPEHFKNGGNDTTMAMLQAIEGFSGGRAGYENVLSITSWRNIGFEDADFGSGKTARVMTYVRALLVPHCVVCLPCKWEQGARVMSRCVTAQHADALLQEITTL
uniref:Uncharacterized protein n=1 Tax=Leersia perrieri TaxID=77586 RepID=A0A0D9WXE1_9ORYZ